MKVRMRPFILILAFIVLALLAVRCQPQPDPTPEPFPEPVDFEADVLPRGTQLPQVELTPGQSLVNGQIVVAGGGEDIDRVLSQLPQLELERLSSISFEYLEQYRLTPPGPGDETQQSQGKQRRRGLTATQRQQMASLRIDLYAHGQPLPDTLLAIANQVESMRDELQLGVVAEPNYVMGFEISGDPWAVEGSPWAVEGSPWAVEGSASDSGPHASDHFWQQWALDSDAGIGLFAGGDPPLERSVPGRGEGIRIAVFDTSPFSGPGGYRFERWGPPVIDPLALTVSEPVSVPNSQAGDEATTISDHGLFVSGLAYAVAPSADIHLIKVLNDHGQGTLQAFIEALDLYMQQTLTPQEGLHNTVINLSLGTSEPDDEELPPEARRAISRMLDVWGYRSLAGEETPVFSLELPMLIAEGLGATVVAASGNDSTSPPDAAPEPAQIPAAYSLVIGVEATNKQRERSCFANDGGLAAPGGDGVDRINDCLPPDFEASCANSAGGDCGVGVVSYVMADEQGFAYWLGTSFATPLVSGLAGLVQENGAGDPAAVRNVVICSAQGTGVVDVAAALNSCAAP